MIALLHVALGAAVGIAAVVTAYTVGARRTATNRSLAAIAVFAVSAAAALTFVVLTPEAVPVSVLALAGSSLVCAVLVPRVRLPRWLGGERDTRGL